MIRMLPRKKPPSTPRKLELRWEAEELLPRNRMLTEYEFFHLPTNRGLEYVDGHIEVLPVVSEYHQLVLIFLFESLKRFVVSRKLGLVLFAGIKLVIRAGKYREPDIIFMRAANAHRRHDNYWLGADLAMEIVSPDDPPRDYKTKRREYAEAGIPEYWIVDPKKEMVTVLVLEDRKYRVHGEFHRGETASSAVLPGFSVAVDDVFAEHE